MWSNLSVVVQMRQKSFERNSSLMNINCLKISVLFVMLAALCFFGINTIHSQKEEPPCNKCIEQLRDKKGELVLFVSDELEKYAIHCVTPELPNNAHINRIAVIDVLTDQDGNVVCASSGKENSVEVFAENAVRQWKFKPVIVDGKPVALWGKIEVDIKRDKAGKQCEVINQHNK